MHLVRWGLTTGWLLIIVSLLYDPFTPRFTEPDHPWSPLRLPETCVSVQGACLTDAPYPLGTTVFWSLVVPRGSSSRWCSAMSSGGGSARSPSSPRSPVPWG